MTVGGVVLPRVLAVEDDRDDVAFRVFLEVAGDIGEVLDEVGDGVVGMPVAVFEADQVGQAVVAEKHARLERVDPDRREQRALA